MFFCACACARVEAQYTAPLLVSNGAASEYLDALCVMGGLGAAEATAVSRNESCDACFTSVHVER